MSKYTEEGNIKYFFYFYMVLVVILIYGQVISHDFVSFDDDLYVTQNEIIQKGITKEGLKWAFSLEKGNGTYWHPLTWLSHMVDVTLFGDKAGCHLLVNIAWHVLNSILLFLIIYAATRSIYIGAFVSIFFAVHPLNVESVAWVASRKTLLSSFFWLACINIYFYYSKNRTIVGYLLVSISLFFGLMAKPMLITLPFVLLLLDYWPLKTLTFLDARKNHENCNTVINTKKSQSHLILEKVPLLILALLVSFAIKGAVNNTFNVASFDLVPLSLRIKNYMLSYFYYIKKFILPVELAPFYPYPKELSFFSFSFSLIFIGMLTYLFLWYGRKRKMLTVGWLWFLGTIVPVSGIFQVGLWPAYADRWAYIPIIGLLIICASILEWFVEKKDRKVLFFVVTICVMSISYGAVSYVQVAHWKNSISLFQHTVDVTDNNTIAHINLGGGLAKSGKISDAITHYKKAIDISPNDKIARSNLIKLLNLQEQFEEAEKYYEEGVDLEENSFAEVLKREFTIEKVGDVNNENSAKMVLEERDGTSTLIEKKADTLIQQKKFDKAVELYKEALRYQPDNYELHNNLAVLYVKIEDKKNAKLHYSKALELASDKADIHYNYGYFLATIGLQEKAEDHFKESIRIDPTHIDSFINMGILLAQQNRSDEAYTYFQNALEIDPESIKGHKNVGILHFQLGKIEKARKHFSKANQLAPDDKHIQWLLNLVK